jgi:hypothetical protein
MKGRFFYALAENYDVLSAQLQRYDEYLTECCQCVLKWATGIGIDHVQ